MTPEQSIFEGDYTNGKPYVKARVVIVNPENLRQTTIEKEFWIDSGFDGGIHIAQFHMSEITMIGVSPVPGPIGVAGGERRQAYHCLAYLQQIGEFEFPSPGIEVMLVLHGSARHGLLGLEVLKHWTTKLDGQNQSLSIIGS